MPMIASKRPRKGLGFKKPAPAAKAKKLSAFDRLKPYIGVISGPGDLSTNPKYMEGYGQSRRP